METGDRLAQLESEIKVLKNEVQAVLLDLRDKYLEAENPFNTPPSTATSQHLIVDRQTGPTEARPSTEPQGKPASNEGDGGAANPPGPRNGGGDPRPDPPPGAGGARQREDDSRHHSPQRTR